MNVTPGIVCQWTCTKDYLRTALTKITKHGSTLLSIVPEGIVCVSSEFKPDEFTIDYYLVLYKNPPEVVCSLCSYPKKEHPNGLCNLFTVNKDESTNPCLEFDADLHIDWKGRFERLSRLIVSVDWFAGVGVPTRDPHLNAIWDAAVKEGRQLQERPTGTPKKIEEIG